MHSEELRQEDCKLEASLGYTARPCLKKQSQELFLGMRAYKAYRSLSHQSEKFFICLFNLSHSYMRFYIKKVVQN
jgi:hypothetical protein